MKMKKVVVTLACVLMLGSTSMTALAHGHGGGHYSRNTSYTRTYSSYSVCNVQGCTAAGVHEHNGSYYCGHTGGYSCGTNHRGGRHH